MIHFDFLVTVQENYYTQAEAVRIHKCNIGYSKTSLVEPEKLVPTLGSGSQKIKKKKTESIIELEAWNQSSDKGRGTLAPQN